MLTETREMSAPPILIVEDSMPDYQAVLRVLRKLGTGNPVHHCETGQDALDYLHGEANAQALRPGLILLDLNLPGVDGREVLKQVKSDEHLKTIPVVIFTTSDSEKDVAECYESGANSYITKPVDLLRLTEVMGSLCTYWFGMVKLPGNA